MPDGLPPLTEQHRRQLMHFSRWLAAVADSDEATRESIIDLARRLDRNGMDARDRGACLQMMDDLIAPLWERRPDAQ